MVSPDGYIRITLDELRAVPLTHLMSHLDAADGGNGLTDAVATDITGYTEWVSAGVPAISIGWDWQMSSRDGKCRLCVVHYPRSNLMLTESSRRNDVGQPLNDVLLKEFVERMPWQDEVMRFLSQSTAC